MSDKPRKVETIPSVDVATQFAPVPVDWRRYPLTPAFPFAPYRRPVTESVGNVDVAVVVAVKYFATTGPTTESLAYGEVVPMPTLPVLK